MKKQVKQVIVIRKDLGMRKGKMIAQGCHASLGVILGLMEKRTYSDTQHHEWMLSFVYNSDLDTWLNGPFVKIVVYVESEKELLDLHIQAEIAGISNALIQDSGFTEFKGIPTYTCLAIGPAYTEKIDKITGNLPLL